MQGAPLVAAEPAEYLLFDAFQGTVGPLERDAAGWCELDDMAPPVGEIAPPFGEIATPEHVEQQDRIVGIQVRH
jgi:hypothetical protein